MLYAIRRLRTWTLLAITAGERTYGPHTLQVATTEQSAVPEPREPYHCAGIVSALLAVGSQVYVRPITPLTFSTDKLVQDTLAITNV